MPVLLSEDSDRFPPLEYVDEEGLLAVGANFKVNTLLNAYSKGIFPWFTEEDLIYWFCPDPRMVLLPGNLRVSSDMKRIIRKGTFMITYDRAFEEVILKCSAVERKDQPGSWITDDFISGYVELHRQGYAHSAEAWMDGKLVGGLYGVSLGRCFYGESMFSEVSNASKAAFISLVQALFQKGFEMIDCQVYTSHLESLGAKLISRDDFLEKLDSALGYPTLSGDWGNFIP